MNDLNYLVEALVMPVKASGGNLNHDIVTRGAADLNNPDLGIQTTEMPGSFEEILTAGSMLRRKTGSKQALAVGVPLNLDDIAEKKPIRAASVAKQVNGEEEQGDDNSFEDGTVEHPDKIDARSVSEMTSYLAEK